MTDSWGPYLAAGGLNNLKSARWHTAHAYKKISYDPVARATEYHGETIGQQRRHHGGYQGRTKSGVLSAPFSTYKAMFAWLCRQHFKKAV